MRKIFGFMFLFIVMFSLVSAIPPVLQANEGDMGLTLEILTPITIPINTAITVHVHAFNSSSGLIMSSPLVSCDGMLINNRGKVMATQMATVLDDHFTFGLNTTVAPTTGNYHYTLHCNTSEIGGFHTGYFQVTDDGLELPEGIVIVVFSILSLAMLLIMLWTLYLILLDLTALQTTFKTVFLGMASYIGNMAIYYFLVSYLPLTFLVEVSLWGLGVFGFTHMFLPLVGLIFSWIKNGRAE